MTSMAFIFMGVVTALVVVAGLAKTYAGKPKKAEKGEKAEVIKRLIALAESENGVPAIASPPPKDLRVAPTSATHTVTLRISTDSPGNPTRPIPLRPNLNDAEIEEKIRQRAYELYQKRGGVGGNSKDDWLRAREEVLGYKTKAATTSS